MESIAKNINTLGKFCGKRDLKELSSVELQKRYNIIQADVMVLFGGSILCGGDVLAFGMKNKIAKKYVIVGGAGHTTETLRLKMNKAYPDVETKNLSEAKIFSNYLKFKYNLEPDFLECSSTNCGNNVTYLLQLLEENNISFKNIIISQDATMQCRMEAGLKKYLGNSVSIINYATYSATVIPKNEGLGFKEEIWGMWEIDRYISLLLGEIPRLTDDINGYGPKGKDFISHVDIPLNVQDAFKELCKNYSELIRDANPLFASK